MTQISSEDQLETFAPLIAQHTRDSMVFTDPDGLTVWANEPFSRMSGYKLSEVIGKTPGSVLQGEDTDPHTVARIRDAIRDRRSVHCEILNYAKDGTPYWIDLTITPVFDPDGTLTHFMSVERDITESRELAHRTEAALAKEHERRRERRILYQMSGWLFAAKSMDELQDVVTQSMSKLFPRTNGELFIYSNSRDTLDRVSSWGAAPGDPHLDADQCWGLRRGQNYCFGTNEIDFPCDHVVSHAHPYFCLPIIAEGDIIGLMHLSFPDHSVESDRSEGMCQTLSLTLETVQICAEQISLAAANVQLQSELQNKSVKDALTGLWNRRWFLDMAGREIRRAEAKDTPLSLAIIDADHFKKFNDVHGHDAGDTVLKVLGAHLSDMDTAGLFPCRIGGEEFAVICAGADAEAAEKILDGLRTQLSDAQIVHSGTTLPRVTISIGIAQLGSGEDLQSLIKRADGALYEAKEAGRDRTVLDGVATDTGAPERRVASGGKR